MTNETRKLPNNTFAVMIKEKVLFFIDADSTAMAFKKAKEILGDFPNFEIRETIDVIIR